MLHRTHLFFTLGALFFLISSPLSLAKPRSPQAVSGFADLHNHVFAELAHGGAWLHGHVIGPEAEALAGCDVEFDPLALHGDHGRVRIPLISTFLGRTLGSSGDTGNHLDKNEGYPYYRGWPRWDTIAHQQNWEGHLKAAHENGLSLIVISAVNFGPLCELMPAENRQYDCDDMNTVLRQLEAARAFEKSHSWFKIVTSSAEARSAIRSGKLAVVLSVEVSDLFGESAWQPQLQQLEDLGVRTFQIVHQLNNRFASPATHNKIFRVFQWIKDFKENGQWYELFTPWKFGFDLDARGFNRRGLTPEGRELVQAMIDRSLLIDIAHLSEVGVRDLLDITTEHLKYPIYVSHGHFRDAMDDGRYSVFEKSSSDWVVEAIRDSGGMFGLRTGPEKTRSFPDSPVPNNCAGSSKSFAQTYQYGMKKMRVPVAFSSDMNGFIQQTRPRFGNPDETCGGEADPEIRAQQRQAQSSPLGRRFDQSGLGNISQLPDLYAELKNLGADLEGLENSSENFIRMWERAEEINRLRSDFKKER